MVAVAPSGMVTLRVTTGGLAALLSHRTTTGP